MPDGTTILRFRHPLEEHGLTRQIFDEIQGPAGTAAVVAEVGDESWTNIIAARNSTEARDPEMKQTLRGKNWHFGMKVHIGATSGTRNRS